MKVILYLKGDSLNKCEKPEKSERYSERLSKTKIGTHDREC